MHSRILPIAHKEWLHILRDWQTLGIAIVLPILLLVIFGYGIRFDVEDIKIIIRDQDRSPASRELIQKITASPTFTLLGYAENQQELTAALDSNAAALALDINPGFAKKLAAGRSPKLQFLIDGAENNTGLLAMGYMQVILTDYNSKLIAENLGRLGLREIPGVPAVTLPMRFWFNESLTSSHYIVPGVIVMVMMLLCTLLTSLTIVRERERGTLEQLIATPAKPYEIIIGKLLPYFGLSVFDTLMIALAGIVFFGVPFRGDLLIFLVFTCLFAIVGLGIGITISSFARNQVFALQLAIMSQMLPTILLSGFMFPIKEMPLVLQWITKLIPARYVITALRGIFLKNTGWSELWPELLILSGFALLFLILASKNFHKDLE